MHSHDEESQLAAADRRAQDRKAGSSAATVSIQAATLSAVVENHSKSGLFLLVDEPVSVMVTWEDEGELRTDRALLRRLTSLPGQRAGLGLEIVEGLTAGDAPSS
ncbi:MAG: hypothetical protein AAGG01_16045 [Planctomycetota bacterium]